jgi:hypothetical protein
LVNGIIPAGVPSKSFPKDGECYLNQQCHKCSFEVCCDYTSPSNINGGDCRKEGGCKLPGEICIRSAAGTMHKCIPGNRECKGSYSKRRDTRMCKLCGYYKTGSCTHTSTCADARWAEQTCSVSCA